MENFVPLGALNSEEFGQIYGTTLIDCHLDRKYVLLIARYIQSIFKNNFTGNPL